MEHVIQAPLNQSIIVRAGPGAGKTYLLAERIAHVFKSELPKNRRVACITYTNTGVDELREELVPRHFQALPYHLEIGTIHGFLIENVLRPYGHTISKFANHVPPNIQILQPSGYAQRFITQKTRTLVPHQHRLLESIHYNHEGTPVCYQETNGWKPSLAQMRSFKYKMHSEGCLDQNDVLHYSYQILRRFETVCESLSSRFLTILVDEFQDTTILQSEILKLLLAQGKTSLFLVGDPDQSIYGFTGAASTIFNSYLTNEKFRCDMCGDIQHTITVNRRASERIITFLDRLSSIEPGQVASEQMWRDIDIPVQILIPRAREGVDIEVYRRNVVSFCNSFLEQHGLLHDSNASIGILTFKNADVSELRRVFDADSTQSNREFEKLKRSSLRLYNVIVRFLQALQYRKLGYWSEARDLIDSNLTQILFGVSPDFCKYDDDSIGLDRQLFHILIWYVTEYLTIDEDASILELCKKIKDIAADFALSLSGKRIKTKLKLLDCSGTETNLLVRQITVATGLSSVQLEKTVEGNYCTIHQAKGRQKDSIIVFCHTSHELEDWLVSPDIEAKEATRCGYVAFSRARKALIICCETVTDDSARNLSNLAMVNTVELDDEVRPLA